MTRLLSGIRPDGRGMSLAEHEAVHGPLPKLNARELLAVFDGGAVRGRGGAGFPVARKLQGAGGRGSVLVNATESEPASLKDQTLLTRVPHLVLDGAQLAARVVRAREVVVVTHIGSGVGPALAAALAERRDVVQVRRMEVPARYVSGEASALASAVRGGQALPVLHDQPLAVKGPGGRPAVVLNAESLADLAILARLGPSRYRELGTVEEPGTVLLTVRGPGVRPIVVEVELGTSLGRALGRAGGAPEHWRAVLVGGWFGRWLALPAALDVPVSHGGLRAAGGVLGAGVVMGLGRQECGLRATAQVVRHLAGQSAGQCGPCTNGLPALASAFEALVAGFADPSTQARVEQLCGLVDGRGLCGLPDGVAALTRSALQLFAEDLEQHRGVGCGLPAGDALAVPGCTDVSTGASA